MSNKTRLKAVQAEAKKLKRASPSLTHVVALKKAWAIILGKSKKVTGTRTRRKKVKGVSTKSRSHVDKNRITANIQLGRTRSLGSARVAKNFFYKGFLIEGKTFELEEKNRSGRIKKMIHTFWRLCSPKTGIEQSGWFYSRLQAKSYARHLSK